MKCLNNKKSISLKVFKADVAMLGGCLLLFLAGIASSTALAATINTNTVTLVNPTSFDTTTWTWPPQSGGYTSYSVNITPEADGSPGGYLFSSEFFFSNGGSATQPNTIGYGYVGLQTEEPSPINSKGDVFSIYGAKDPVNTEPNTTYLQNQTSWTARNAFPWLVGHIYNLTVSYVSSLPSGEVWGAWVTDTSTGVKTEIGELIVPDNFGMLGSSSAAIHQRFLGSTTSCADLQYSDVEFTNPLLNKTIKPLGSSNYQPTIAGCTQDYGVVDIPNGVRSVIGGLPPSTATLSTTATVFSVPGKVSKSQTIANSQTPSKINATDTDQTLATAKVNSFYLVSFSIAVILLSTLIIIGERSIFKRKRHSPDALSRFYTKRN